MAKRKRLTDADNAAAERREQEDRDEAVRALAIEMEYALRAADRLLHDAAQRMPELMRRDDWRVIDAVRRKLAAIPGNDG